MIVVSHPTGNRNVRAIAEGAYKAGMLKQFITTIAVTEQSKWIRLVPASLRAELLRRSYQVPSTHITSHPFLELARLLLPRVGFRKAVQHEMGCASVDAVYKNLDASVAKYITKQSGIKAVYAYEDGALETFRKAKQKGITCIYDLPIAYWETLRSLLQEEAERLPQWKKTLGGGIDDSIAKLERKTEEMQLADVVVGPGNFVLHSLPGWAKDKRTIMSPFGTPDRADAPARPPAEGNNNNRPLRVLFVGTMGQRKGLGDLFEAVKILNTTAIELVVMGPLLDDVSFYKKELSRFTYEPTRPHHKVLELMRSCDVFCLPSIVEGRALVMQEAMSQGLPIIITANTGGEDLVKEKETGFLVPIRSASAIADKLNWFLENRDAVKEMGETARHHAATYTWNAYAGTIIATIRNLL